MNKHDVERAIIANRPGEPFVLVQRVTGDEIEDLDALDWQADTDPPKWKQVQRWVKDLAPLPPHPIAHLAEIARDAVSPDELLAGLKDWADVHAPRLNAPRG